MPSQITQDSLIQALILLRQAHPELPAIKWEISTQPSVDGLHGASFGARSVDDLLAYERALGGEITPRHMYESRGVRMQSLYLVTRFADVRIEIRGGVPAPILSVVAA